MIDITLDFKLAPTYVSLIIKIKEEHIKLFSYDGQAPGQASIRSEQELPPDSIAYAVWWQLLFKPVRARLVK